MSDETWADCAEAIWEGAQRGCVLGILDACGCFALMAALALVAWAALR